VEQAEVEAEWFRGTTILGGSIGEILDIAGLIEIYSEQNSTISRCIISNVMKWLLVLLTQGISRRFAVR
jgi:hypothetical protein